VFEAAQADEANQTAQAVQGDESGGLKFVTD